MYRSLSPFLNRQGFLRLAFVVSRSQIINVLRGTSPLVDACLRTQRSRPQRARSTLAFSEPLSSLPVLTSREGKDTLPHLASPSSCLALFSGCHALSAEHTPPVVTV